MPNIDLLKKTRDHILKFPDTHDQGLWHCDTAMCIAGHAAVLAGAELKQNPEFMNSVSMYVGDRMVAAEEYAKEQLDMGWQDATYLFYCMDNEKALERLNQVIQLWEEGKNSDDLDVNDWIYDDEDDYDEDYD
jgi:hypothetical protein